MVSDLKQCDGFSIVIVSSSTPAYVKAQRILRVVMSALSPNEDVHFRHRCSSDWIAYFSTHVTTSEATDACHNTLPMSTDPPAVFHITTSFTTTISRYLFTRAAFEVMNSSAGRCSPNAARNACSMRFEEANGSTKCASPLKSAIGRDCSREM